MRRRNFVRDSLIIGAGSLFFPRMLLSEQKWGWWITHKYPGCPKEEGGTKEELENFLTENFNYHRPLEAYLNTLKENSNTLFKKIYEYPAEFSGNKKIDEDSMAKCYKGDGFEIYKISYTDVDIHDRCFEIKSKRYQADILFKRENGKTIISEFSEAIDLEKIAAERKAILSSTGKKYLNMATFFKPKNSDIEMVEIPLPAIYPGSEKYENSIKPYVEISKYLLKELPSLNKNRKNP